MMRQANRISKQPINLHVQTRVFLGAVFVLQNRSFSATRDPTDYFIQQSNPGSLFVPVVSMFVGSESMKKRPTF